MTNFTLNSLDEIYSIEHRVTKMTGKVKVLPHWKQLIFWELYGLSDKDYKDKLGELKTHWIRKTKLTNE